LPGKPLKRFEERYGPGIGGWQKTGSSSIAAGTILRTQSKALYAGRQHPKCTESSSLAMMRGALSGKMPSGRHSVDGIDNDKLPTPLIVDKEYPLGALVC
jgi:hypothetical protein